jgi:NADP-dependent 3-hydroxy acid dehydrogenase YdfG
MKNFKNKVVVITGAGSGMGRAYAIEFCKTWRKNSIE